MTGSGVGSSANGVTSPNPYYRANTATTGSTGPSLTDTIGRNLVTIGSKFLSDLINGDPNKIAAEAANPYNSPSYIAQLQAQQAAQIAASSRAAQLQAAARASPVPGSAAYYAAQNNRLVNGGRATTSAPIGSPTLTPEQIREAARKASIISDYYKNHPSAGIIGTGLYRMQTSTTPTATATATATSTPVPDQVIEPDSTNSEVTVPDGSDSSLQPDSTSGQVVNTISYPDTTSDQTLTGSSSTTCAITALNAGNCNPNFRNKICDLGCTNNEQAAVSSLCQRNGCTVAVSLSTFLISFPIRRQGLSNTDELDPGYRPHSQLPSNHRHNRLPQNSGNGQRKRPEILQRPHTQCSR